MSEQPSQLEQLARYQAEMLAILHEGHSPAVMLRDLARAAKAAGISSHVEKYELRMVATASELVKKWGRRHDSENAQSRMGEAPKSGYDQRNESTNVE